MHVEKSNLNLASRISCTRFVLIGKFFFCSHLKTVKKRCKIRKQVILTWDARLYESARKNGTGSNILRRMQNPVHRQPNPATEIEHRTNRFNG